MITNNLNQENKLDLKPFLDGKDCHFCNKPMIKDGKVTGDLYVNKDEKWASHKACYIKTKKPEEITMGVMMHCHSIGDTITVTPVLRELRRLYPQAKIDLITCFPELFKYNRYVTNVLAWDAEKNRDRMIRYDFQFIPFQPDNKVFPQHCSTHSVDFVMYGAFRRSLPLSKQHYSVEYTYHEENSVNKKCKDFIDNPFILIHPYGTEWPSRSFPQEFWQGFIEEIKKEYPDYELVSIGGSRKEMKEHEMNNFLELNGVISMYNKLSLLESLCLMNSAKAIITSDTGTLHLAGCADETPILGLFSVIRSRHRLPVRNGEKGYNFVAVDGECNCTDNHTLMDGDMNLTTCPRGYEKYRCFPTVERAMQGLNRLMYFYNDEPLK